MDRRIWAVVCVAAVTLVLATFLVGNRIKLADRISDKINTQEITDEAVEPELEVSDMPLTVEVATVESEEVLETEEGQEESLAEVEEKTQQEPVQQKSEPDPEPEIEEVKDTGIVVCIDPGHFKGASDVDPATINGYEEGQYTIKIGLALRDELKKYGISSYMTREGDSISIGGYSNKELDKNKIRLRGEYGKDADIFVSLHTNSNGNDANGCPTFSQPMELNKCAVIVNTVGIKDQTVLDISNEIGKAVTKVNYDAGLSFTEAFDEVTTDTVKEIVHGYNDGINNVGTVYYRLGSKGDYYGVLRGATNVNVPGIIIEHGYHSVEGVRLALIDGDLVERWAKADAYGIAKGFGIVE